MRASASLMTPSSWIGLSLRLIDKTIKKGENGQLYWISVIDRLVLRISANFFDAPSIELPLKLIGHIVMSKEQKGDVLNDLNRGVDPKSFCELDGTFTSNLISRQTDSDQKKEGEDGPT
jgi:hypothetical protein